MKCDELKAYGMADPAIDDEYEMYKVAEVDAAIAELKEKLHDVDNKWNEQCKEIAELKAKNRVLQSFYDLHGNVDNYIDQLKAKLESTQASAYAESVDAGMRERRLRRALWLARALRARDIQRWWIAATCAPITERACSIWKNVEIKCRAKEEKYR